MALASRMMDLGTETAFEVLAKARALEAQGREIIHLEIGEPDFETPKHIVEAGVTALRQGYTHYGPTPGLRAIAVTRTGRETGDSRARVRATHDRYPLFGAPRPRRSNLLPSGIGGLARGAQSGAAAAGAR